MPPATLAADSVASPDLNAHADMVADVILEPLFTIVTKQALHSFGGGYRATENGSLITMIFDELPRLVIEEFVSNGDDFRKTLASLTGVRNPDELSIRIYLTGSTSQTTSRSKQTFRAALQDKTGSADNGTLTCVSWMDVGKLKHNEASLDEFDVNEDGVAIGVEIPALDLILRRTLKNCQATQLGIMGSSSHGCILIVSTRDIRLLGVRP